MTQAENEFYRSVGPDWYTDEDNWCTAISLHIDAMEESKDAYFLDGWMPSDASEVRSETIAEAYFSEVHPHYHRIDWPEEDEDWVMKFESWLEENTHRFAIRWWDDEPCPHTNRSISEPDLCQDCERHVGDEDE